MSASFESRSRKAVLSEVIGLPLSDAEIVLRQAGFAKIRAHYVQSYEEDFRIVDQAPRSGLLIDRDREIVLRVARQNFSAYLPQIFQQAAGDGTTFLGGLLYIVQHVFDQTYTRLDGVHKLFDPQTTEPEFLPWLASWLAITLSPDWDELQRRKMLLAATRLFPYRGTARAIAEFVRIYTGATVTIEENSWPFAGFRIGVRSSIGEDAVILPPMNLAHCFVVRLDRPVAQVSEDEIIKIHQIIQNQKPAHTAYFLAFSEETETAGMGSFLEIGVGGIGTGEPVAEVAPVEPASNEIAQAKRANEAARSRSAGAAKKEPVRSRPKARGAKSRSKGKSDT